MRILIIIIISVCCIHEVSLAESDVKLKPLIIEGILDSDNAADTVEAYVYLNTSEFGFERLELARTEHQSYKEKLTHGQFKIAVPSPSALFYLHIFYKTPKETSTETAWIDRVFVVEAGDSLSVKMSKHNMEFSGRGAEKMNCQMEIFRNCYSATAGDLTLFKEGDYERYIETFESKMSASLKVQLEIIQQYKGAMNPAIEELLRVNCYALRYSAVRQMNIYLNNNAVPAYSLALKRYYGKSGKDKLPFSLDGSAAEQAPLLTNYLLEDEIFNIFIKNDVFKHTGSDEFVEYLYQKISNDYRGILKDKLMVLLFLRYNQNNYIANYFDEVYQGLSDKYKDALRSRKTKLAKGTPFFNFELIDENDNIVKLGDLSGKVVLIDFWFTGCSGCLQLASALKPVKHYFKNNKKLVFLSVSVDKSKAIWLRSIKEGKYTQSGATNLYTGELNRDHPLIKYYNITSYPTLYVVKDRKMFEAHPPRPMPLQKNGGNLVDANGMQLIEILKGALSSL